LVAVAGDVEDVVDVAATRHVDVDGYLARACARAEADEEAVGDGRLHAWAKVHCRRIAACVGDARRCDRQPSAAGEAGDCEVAEDGVGIGRNVLLAGARVGDLEGMVARSVGSLEAPGGVARVNSSERLVRSASAVVGVSANGADLLPACLTGPGVPAEPHRPVLAPDRLEVAVGGSECGRPIDATGDVGDADQPAGAEKLDVGPGVAGGQ